MTETTTAPHRDDAVLQMLCLRNDELLAEKEALAAQLDRLEEQLEVLRSQADALHRIGYVLDIDPGDDLTREAPARVNALAVERDEAYARGKQAFDDLRRAKADRAAAIQQAVARARRDWAAQGSPWVKARWQAEALEDADKNIPARHARARIILRNMAAELRRQAEETNHD